MGETACGNSSFRWAVSGAEEIGAQAEILPIRCGPMSRPASPVAAYLLGLPSAGSRTTMLTALRRICRLVAADGDASDPHDYEWHRLGWEHVNVIRAALIEQSLSPATINLTLAALRGVLHTCARLGLMSYEQMQLALDGLKRAPGSRLLAGRHIEDHEQRALVAACADDPDKVRASRDLAVLALGLAGGLRRAEIGSVTVGTWAPDTRTLVVRGKGDKDRVVAISHGGADAIDAWLDIYQGADPDPLGAGAPLVCGMRRGGHPTGKALSGQAVADILQSRAAQAGLAPVKAHDMRRSMASNHLLAGTDVLIVSALLGHSSPVTTQRYDLRSERAKLAAADHISFPYRRRVEVTEEVVAEPRWHRR